MNDIVSGRLYFIKNEFFEFVSDSYLKRNKENTKRPHYYAFRDSNTNLLWMIPCSSQIDKYQRIIQDKISAGKKHDHIQIVKVNGIKQVFLYQDMFPIIGRYIEDEYIKQNAFMEIKDPKKISAIENNAKKIIKLMKHGVKFTPTQPDIIKIEQLMIREFGKDTD
jgi:hypothetical protein